MKRGELALLVPREAGLGGGRKVAAELKRHRVSPLGTGHLVLAAWNDKSRAVIEQAKTVSAFYPSALTAKELAALPPAAIRIAKLWNWSIATAAQRVTTPAVMKLLASLNLQIKDDQVYDRREKKNLGRVESRESQSKKGNWTLCQTRGWTIIPGWFGWWEKLYCWSRTYTGASCSGGYQMCDFISAQVDGPNHYAYQSRYNSPVAYAENWTYIWVGMTRGGRAYSYARLGSRALQITSPNMWPHL